jgi:hypothetical protein
VSYRIEQEIHRGLDNLRHISILGWLLLSRHLYGWNQRCELDMLMMPGALSAIITLFIGAVILLIGMFEIQYAILYGTSLAVGILLIIAGGFVIMMSAIKLGRLSDWETKR